MTRTTKVLRVAALPVAVAAILLARQEVQPQRRYGFADLPAAARPADSSAYLELSATGTLYYVCRGTDVKGKTAWYLRRSEATLSDARNSPASTSQFSYSGMPRVRVEATWQAPGGGKIIAAADNMARGTLPAAPDIGWQRYDVQSRQGAGGLADAKSVIRIAAWRHFPYDKPCDRSRLGAELRVPFTATDIFLK
jgi:hypothetical protein